MKVNDTTKQAAKYALPIDSHVSNIIERIRSSQVVILKASPGSGKTTRIPLALTNVFKGEIAVLEPRRLAARMAAEYCASEDGSEVGSKIGYHFKLERKKSKDTRLCFYTEGMLIKKLKYDTRLDHMDCVVLDEFHERHLQTDLSLGLLQHLISSTRPNLKILIMSATIDTDVLESYFTTNGIKVDTYSIEAPRYPLEELFLPKTDPKQRLSDQISDAIDIILNRRTGPIGILVFLPGTKEIADAAHTIIETFRNKVKVFTLHGQGSKSDTDAATNSFKNFPNDVRVILSTNVAESSVTIPGIQVVVDTGLARITQPSTLSGFVRLRTTQISKSSSIQRAHRANRLGPGLVLRLQSKHEHLTAKSFETPEILRSSLADTVLELKSIDPSFPAQFPWLVRPSPSQLTQAHQELFALQAISSLDPEDHSRLTEFGIELGNIPLESHLASLLTLGAKSSFPSNFIRWVGALSDKTIASPSGPISISAMILERRTNPNVVSASDRILDRLTSIYQELIKHAPTLSDTNYKSKDDLIEIFTRSFADRAAKRKKKVAKGYEYQFASGGSVLFETSALAAPPEWILVIDAFEFDQMDPRITVYCETSMDALQIFNSHLVRSSFSNDFRQTNEGKKLIEIEESFYLNMVLERIERPSQIDSIERADFFLADVLRLESSTKSVAQTGGATVTPIEIRSVKCREQFLNFADDEMKMSLYRLETFLAAIDSDQSAQHLQTFRNQFLTYFCKALSSESASLGRYFRSFDEWKDNQGFETFISIVFSNLEIESEIRLFIHVCPDKIQLKGARSLPITYFDPDTKQAPIVTGFIQDFFGLRQLPKICESTPVSAELLGPNRRPIQRTQNLESFWSVTYPMLKRELERNYPRHFWPDDPADATPQLHLKRRT